MKMSVSKIKKFLECPRSWAQQYVEGKWDESESFPIQVGKIVHGVLERVAQGQGLEDALQQSVTEDTKNASIEALSSARELSEQYLASEYADFDNVVDVEREFLVEVGEHQLNGIIDRVDDLGNGIYEIIDYKTGFVPIGQDEMDHSLQMHSYHYAARQLYPAAQRFVMSIDQVRQGQRITTIPSEEYLENIAIYLRAMGDKMEEAVEAGEFEPRLFKYCCYCHVRHDCPAYLNAISNPLDVLFHEGVDVNSVIEQVQALESVEKIIKQRKDELDVLLMQAVENSGEDKLKTEKHWVGFSVSRRGEYPTELVLPLLQQHDVPLIDVVSVQKTKVDKAAKGNSELKSALDRIKRTRLGTPRPSITEIEV
jgi:RecB family exonuclease